MGLCYGQHIACLPRSAVRASEWMWAFASKRCSKRRDVDIISITILRYTAQDTHKQKFPFQTQPTLVPETPAHETRIPGGNAIYTNMYPDPAPPPRHLYTELSLQGGIESPTPHLLNFLHCARKWSGTQCLQWPTTNKVTPRSDLAGDALLLGQLLAHALGEEDSSLINCQLLYGRTFTH